MYFLSFWDKMPGNVVSTFWLIWLTFSISKDPYLCKLLYSFSWLLRADLTWYFWFKELIFYPSEEEPARWSSSESLSDSTAVFTLETLDFSKWCFSSARSSILPRSAICFLSSASLAFFSALAVASAAFFLASLIFSSALLLTSATFSSVWRI